MIALEALKQAHRMTWASGDYPRIAELVTDVGEHVVRSAGVRAGSEVLDVAAGDGNAAIPAALAGARVIASDLTPELFVAGRDRLLGERGRDVLLGGRGRDVLLGGPGRDRLA